MPNFSSILQMKPGMSAKINEGMTFVKEHWVLSLIMAFVALIGGCLGWNAIFGDDGPELVIGPDGTVQAPSPEGAGGDNAGVVPVDALTADPAAQGAAGVAGAGGAGLDINQPPVGVDPAVWAAMVLDYQRDQEIRQYQREPAIPVICLLYTSPSPRDRQKSRMPSSA